MNSAAPSTNPAGEATTETGEFNEIDLLGALRDQSSFSFDSYGSLDEVLRAIEANVGEKITRFANINVETKIDDIKVFSVEDFVEPEDGQEASVLPVQLYDGAQTPVCAISVSAKLFFYMLNFALGGDEEDDANADGGEISEAETAVFNVLCQGIADGLYAGISDYSELGGLVSGESGNAEDVAGWIADNELITIKITVTAGEFSDSVLLFVPMEMLEPMREPPVVEEVEEEEVLDLDWVQGLNRAIDRTRIALTMELANSEISLGDVGRLHVGQCIDVGMTMQNVPVCDLEGNVLFCANLEQLSEGRQLRVTGSIINIKGAKNDLLN